MIWSDFIGKLFGYARVSTEDQDLGMQIDELKAAGCKFVFSDKASGVRSERPSLDDCLSKLQAGDTLAVWRLDRLGRSMPHLVSIVSELKNRGLASSPFAMELLIRQPLQGNWYSIYLQRSHNLKEN